MESLKKFNYLQESLDTYIEKVSLKLPVPGGGSVVACVAALSSALINMVLNYTIGNKKYTDNEEELKSIRLRNDIILQELSQYIEKDSEVYDNIRRYTAEKKYAEAEKYLKESVEIHMKICGITLKIIDFVEIIAEKGNKNLLSDTVIAAAFAVSIFFAAKTNVLINLKYLKEDKELIKESLNEMKKIEKEVSERGENLYKGILHTMERYNGK